MWQAKEVCNGYVFWTCDFCGCRRKPPARTFESAEQNHCVPRLHSSTHQQDSRARRPTVHRPDEVVLHSLILEFLLRCSLPSVSLLPFCSARCCCSRKLLLPRHCRNQLEFIAVHVLYDVLLRAHVRDPLSLLLPPCHRSSCNVVLRAGSYPST